MEEIEVAWLDSAEHISQAVGVAARALRDSPDTRAVSDDPLVRLEMLYNTFSGMLPGARIAGVRRGGCVLGVACAVGPGRCVASMLPPEARVHEPPPTAADDTHRFLHLGTVMAEHDLDDPHWHVGPVGVEPGFQSMGMGRAAMRLLCDEFDEHRRISWLETAKPENVRFYINFGFEVVHESPMLTSHLWFMRREAQ